jgi:oxidase EvaA
MTATPERILAWLRSRRDASGLQCAPLDWTDCSEWGLEAGTLRRRGGGFFEVAGFQVRSPARGWHGVTRPLIEQPEVGILGFLLRRRAGVTELLLQAKSEPGNVLLTQMAPTVQATRSNYTRAHGGAPTRYLSFFHPRDPASTGDVEQSEHGSSFLGKFNRNAIVTCDGSSALDEGPQHAWHPVADALSVLDVDFAVNTDARSVLCTGDWTMLAENGEPFERWRRSGSFAELLHASYADDPADRQHALEQWIVGLQSPDLFHLTRVPLDRMPGWSLTATGLRDEASSSFVQLYAIQAADREVPNWEQPLLGTCEANRAILLCQLRSGLLHFLVRASPEPGFKEGVQLGPTAVTRHPAFAATPLNDFCADPSTTTPVACVRQSDEGGRFFRTVTEYEIRLVAETDRVPDTPSVRWVTLRQLHRLAQVRALTTNELRSNLSVLLTLL